MSSLSKTMIAVSAVGLVMAVTLSMRAEIGISCLLTLLFWFAFAGGRPIRNASSDTRRIHHAPRCVNHPPPPPSWKTTVFSPVSSTTSK